MNKNTKKNIIIIGAVAFAALFALLIISPGKTNALGVNDVGSDPSAFTGTITVTGIVAGVSQQDPSIIGIMDKKELQCKSQNCKKTYVPFKASGYTPNRGDEVIIQGQFVATAGGYLFMADSVKVVKNHQIGG